MGVDGLIERLARATGPDRELDAEIWSAVTEGLLPIPDYYKTMGPDAAPAYTGSIDAAVTLVPEGWGWDVRSGYQYEDDPYPASALYWPQGDDPCAAQSVEAATPAHALCIAALKAREVSDGNGG